MQKTILIFLCLIPLLTFSQEWKMDMEIATALSEVNRMRTAAGLAPVTLDTSLSKACMQHAKYLTINRKSEKVKGMKAHEEVPELPGYSETGAKAGKNSVINYTKPGTAVSGWEATFYHRIPLLQPNLKTIGIGWYEEPGYWPISLVECISGTEGKAEIPVVYYPADQQTDVPVKMGSEIPHPMGKQGAYGFPLTVYFTQYQTVKAVSCKLTTQRGKTIPCQVSTPENPATYFTQWNSICVIPKSPLDYGKTYTLQISATVDDADFQQKITFITVTQAP